MEAKQTESLYDRLLTATLRYERAERKIQAALAYLENLQGPFSDKVVLRDLLTTPEGE